MISIYHPLLYNYAYMAIFAVVVLFLSNVYLLCANRKLAVVSSCESCLEDC